MSILIFSMQGNVDVMAAPNPSSGRIPPDLTVTQEAGGDIKLSWGVSCVATDDEFGVYEGTIGDFTGHSPRSCSTANGNTITLTPANGNTFYLVVPSNGTREGSYGLRSNGAERLPNGSRCLTQSLGVCL